MARFEFSVMLSLFRGRGGFISCFILTKIVVNYNTEQIFTTLIRVFSLNRPMFLCPTFKLMERDSKIWTVLEKDLAWDQIRLVIFLTF